MIKIDKELIRANKKPRNMPSDEDIIFILEQLLLIVSEEQKAQITERMEQIKLRISQIPKYYGPVCPPIMFQPKQDSPPRPKTPELNLNSIFTDIDDFV